MHYFKLRRSRILLASFLVFAVLMMMLPEIDLGISRLFFNGVSFPRENHLQTTGKLILKLFLYVSMTTVIAIYAFNRSTGQKVGGIDGRRVLFLMLVLVIGPGLIVNTTLKENFGRARPRDVVEFGGSKQFTPAFVISHECTKNCSFTSGDAAGGFFAIALAFALSRRRVVFVAALLFGVAISLARIAVGAHFFSDTMVSFFIVLILSDLLHHYIVLSDVERRAPLPGDAVRSQA